MEAEPDVEAVGLSRPGRGGTGRVGKGRGGSGGV